jgi:type I restriction enzyme S subunit
MRLETFFEKFELFAEAPNAVGKMRELVLELAIQGLLVDQDPKEVSALASLKGCTRAVRPLSVNDAVVPPGWASIPLGCVIASNMGGGTPSKQNPAYWNGSIPWASVKDIQADKYLTTTIDSITEEGLRNSSSNLVPASRLLVVTRMGLGKLAINKIAVAINQDLRAIEPNEALDLDFAYLLFKALKLVGKGVTVKGVTLDELHSMPVALPPLAEQKRIVAKVDELMALCDRLEAQQQERDTRHAVLTRASLARFAGAPTPANLDFLFHKSFPISPADLRKAILTLAVEGSLAESGHAEAPASEVRLGEVVNLLGGYAFKSEWFTKTPGIRLVRNQNISHGELDWRDTEYLPNERADEFAKWALRPGDLVLSLNRPFISTGLKLAWVTEEDCPCLLVQRIVCLRPDPERLLATYLFLWCNAPHFYRDAHVVPSSGVPYIAPNRVAQMKMRLPPLAEQRRIVAKIDQLMAIVDRLETQLSEARIKSAALLDAVIHELLNPTAEIIDLASYRAAVGCYAINKMQGKRYFGRTAAMKVLYLAQAHVGLELRLKPMREAAGPFDSWLYRFEEQGEREAWFKVVDDKKKVEYRPGRALAEQFAQAERLFTVDQRKELDRLLALFSDRTTEEAEIIATLFAAWNDFLIDGHEPSDDEIVREVRENWHEKKERFTPALLRKWLGWLRQNNVVPKGRTPRTMHQTQLLLN